VNGFGVRFGVKDTGGGVPDWSSYVTEIDQDEPPVNRLRPWHPVFRLGPVHTRHAA
jgi:hypothetical protein